MSCMTIFFYKQVQISRSDIRPHIKWAVSLVILHMVTSIFLQGLCGYIWVNILTLSPRRGQCAVSDRIRSSHVIEAHRQLQQISQKPAYT